MTMWAKLSRHLDSASIRFGMEFDILSLGGVPIFAMPRKVKLQASPAMVDAVIAAMVFLLAVAALLGSRA